MPDAAAAPAPAAPAATAPAAADPTEAVEVAVREGRVSPAEMQTLLLALLSVVRNEGGAAKAAEAFATDARERLAKLETRLDDILAKLPAPKSDAGSKLLLGLIPFLTAEHVSNLLRLAQTVTSALFVLAVAWAAMHGVHVELPAAPAAPAVGVTPS